MNYKVNLKVKKGLGLSVTGSFTCLSRTGTIHQYKRHVKIVKHFPFFKALGLCLFFRVFFNFCIPVIPCIAPGSHQGLGEIPNMKMRKSRKVDHSCAGTSHIPVLCSHDPPSFTHRFNCALVLLQRAVRASAGKWSEQSVFLCKSTRDKNPPVVQE